MKVCISQESKSPEALKGVPYNINSPNPLRALPSKKENFLKASVFNHLDLQQD